MQGASREEIEQALSSGAPEQPLAVAVESASTDYTVLMERQVEREGGLPNVLKLPEPCTATEAYAMELFVAELRKLGMNVRFDARVTH